MGHPSPRTYKHLDGDGDGAVERRVAGILGHHGQVDDPVGDLLVVQGVVDAYHWKEARRGAQHRVGWVGDSPLTPPRCSPPYPSDTVMSKYSRKADACTML